MSAPSTYQASPHDGRTNPDTVTVLDVLTDWAHEEQTRPSREGVFIAHKVTPCAACPDKITPGDPAAYGVDGQIEHQTCPDELVVGPKGVCDGCFLEMPLSGICGVC